MSFQQRAQNKKFKSATIRYFVFILQGTVGAFLCFLTLNDECILVVCKVLSVFCFNHHWKFQGFVQGA